MVYLLHIIPVGDDAVLNGVFEGEDASLALGLVSYIAVFLTHTDHDTLKNHNASFQSQSTHFDSTFDLHTVAHSHSFSRINVCLLTFEARIDASRVLPLRVKGQSISTVT